MGKYDALWAYVRQTGCASLKLSFAEIQRITGIPIDHSFLRYKRDLLAFGYQVGKISRKEQTVTFQRMD